MAITDIDEQKLEQFIGHAATEVGAALNVALVTLGHELGLYRAMADGQPVTSQELADRTGTQERYIREWLNVQAASGYVVYESGTYLLPPEHALVLADETSPFSMHGTFQSANAAVAIRERLVERFTKGDGVGWHEHHHDLWHGTERAFATAYRSRASRTRLSGVSAARRTWRKPASCSTSRSRASPAWVPSAARPGCDSDPGVHTSVENP